MGAFSAFTSHPAGGGMTAPTTPSWKYRGGGVNFWRTSPGLGGGLPQGWEKYVDLSGEGGDPREYGYNSFKRDPAYFRNQALPWLHQALNPNQWERQGTTNPWEMVYNNWAKSGASFDELANIINEASGGKINVTGEQINQLGQARQSNYTGALPETVAGLEGFYDKASISASRSIKPTARALAQRAARSGSTMLTTTPTTEAAPATGMMSAAPATVAPPKPRYVPDSSAWKARSMFKD